MTYALGMLLDKGLVMAADTRTNAGVDNVAAFKKAKVWRKAGDRTLVLLSAGNLAITQAVIAHLDASVRLPEDKKAKSSKSAKGKAETKSPMLTAPGMTAAARAVGNAVRAVYDRDAAHLKSHGADFAASFLLGGQVKGGPMRLFMIYAAGNYIEATADTPFFQIGETKYGKPILDRVIASQTSMGEALKCALVSFDSTMRSNLSVGLPIDIVCLPAGKPGTLIERRMDENDAYLKSLRTAWSDGVRQLFGAMPDPDFLNGNK